MPLLTLLIWIFGTTGVFVWLIIYLFILRQEKGERFVGWLAGFVSFVSKQAEKTATANKIQSRVDSFILSVNSEVEGLLPFGLRVKWVPTDTSKEAFVENDRVVVMLDYHKNQDDNLSRATMLFMNKAVIPGARPHIDQKLGKAIDLMMSKKALYSFVEAPSSLGHFVENVLRPEIDSDSELKDYCGVIDVIDERGLFTRVLLKELAELGIRRAGVTETGDTVFESNEFTKFLRRIAEKERGTNVDLTFLRGNIKVALIMVARPENIGDPSMYLRAIEREIRRGTRTFYIFARGHHIDFAKEVVKESLEGISALVRGHEEEFPSRIQDGTIKHTYCAILYSRKSI